MKIRIFKKLVNGVFNVRIQTEDWSEQDRHLMLKFGEPEINLGGEIPVNLDSSSSSSDPDFILDDHYARIMTGSPFCYNFDSRDYGTVENAKKVADAWGTIIENRIVFKITNLRNSNTIFTSEEIMEY